MENTDAANKSICISYRNEDMLERLSMRINNAVRLQCSTLDKFLEIENSLDSTESHEEDLRGKKRRVKLNSRGYSFNHVSALTSQKDLDEIFGNEKSKDSNRNILDLMKNDSVTCILNRRKYKGIVFQISIKGLVIKTRDRKKIKLHWENIDGDNVQVIKIRSGH